MSNKKLLEVIRQDIVNKINRYEEELEQIDRKISDMERESSL
ncbi:hypothetical protein [Aquibacillus saliphilus]|nr:hypothetical protein [Aquibacillus saliphilus]